MRIFMKDTTILEGVGVHFGLSCYRYALNCHLFLIDHTLDTSVNNEKVKFVCFIYTRAVQI